MTYTMMLWNIVDPVIMPSPKPHPTPCPRMPPTQSLIPELDQLTPPLPPLKTNHWNSSPSTHAFPHATLKWEQLAELLATTPIYLHYCNSWNEVRLEWDSVDLESGMQWPLPPPVMTSKSERVALVGGWLSAVSYMRTSSIARHISVS